MNIRLTQIDGALPNLALMRLAHYHRSIGDTVVLTRSVERSLFEPEYDRVYGSSIFDFSSDRREIFRSYFPDAVMGGTGTIFKKRRVEEFTGVYERFDYSDYPEFTASIGYTQRGCRMAGPKSKCREFCEVPEKEGFPYDAQTIAEIWRGAPHPKKIHLLDNDFFGGPSWRERVREMIDGNFRVCFSQGINTRLITDEAAAAMASIQYRDTKFQERRLYTAWDNYGDERPFLKGVDALEKHGIPPKHLMVYMLIGNDIAETWERIWDRFKRMVDRGMEPYPMVFDRRRKDLLCFQRWVITGLYRIVAWPEYERETKTIASVKAWERVYAGEVPVYSMKEKE